MRTVDYGRYIHTGITLVGGSALNVLGVLYLHKHAWITADIIVLCAFLFWCGREYRQAYKRQYSRRLPVTFASVWGDVNHPEWTWPTLAAAFLAFAVLVDCVRMS